MATPEGRLARYLYGVMYDPQTLRLSLVEASSGEFRYFRHPFLHTGMSVEIDKEQLRPPALLGGCHHELSSVAASEEHQQRPGKVLDALHDMLADVKLP